MVDPPKLLQRFFIILLKKCLLDVFEQVYFLNMLKFSESKFHYVYSHELLNHLIVLQKVFLRNFLQRFLENEVLPILRWFYGLTILLLLFSVVISELKYAICPVHVEFALCQINANNWLGWIIITGCPSLIKRFSHSVHDVSLKLGIFII